jgi:hypothetical protein
MPLYQFHASLKLLKLKTINIFLFAEAWRASLNSRADHQQLWLHYFKLVRVTLSRFERQAGNP